MWHNLDDFQGVQFGTSGLRGLVSDLSDLACYAWTKAFLQYFLTRNQFPVNRPCHVAVSGDLRASTGRIIRTACRAIIDSGLTPLDCGRLPTPALALFAMSRRIPGIMVTGSHIPDDRNGIKFFLPDGEITKQDEQQICSQKVEIPDILFFEDRRLCEKMIPHCSEMETDHGAAARSYHDRYADTFPAGLLAGMRLGLYEHSAVGSKLLGDLYESLGAEVLRLERTDEFVPIDTESLPPEVLQKTALWSARSKPDAILSTDGDGDRPLIFDENGAWLCGDVIVILTARLLRAQTVVTPVTTGGLLERTGFFPQVVRTKVGSPYVIEAMRQVMAAGNEHVVGFEPNGGFLIGSPFSMHRLASELRLPVPKNATLTPLPTRDATIVHLAVLALAKWHNMSLSQLVAILPPCHKLSDRIPDYPNNVSSQILQQLATHHFATGHGETWPTIEDGFSELFGTTGAVVTVDLSDGLRMTFANGEVIHLRASGNAPEFRCYVEAASAERSRKLLDFTLARMQAFRNTETG
ncbi:MAG: hypothetical protein FWD31_00870 [Planctomycetaceae bacterium]|nr:hypothetical protein [Planctomycetaceae bacterium]